MADKDQTEVIRLVAVSMGFAMGRMVQPGEVFQFAKLDRNGKERKLPKWAQPADKPLPPKVKVNPDTRPKDAQAAAAAKSGALAAGVVAPPPAPLA